MSKPFSIINHMIAHLGKYLGGAPEVYRERLKKSFLNTKRALRAKGKQAQERLAPPLNNSGLI